MLGDTSMSAGLLEVIEKSRPRSHKLSEKQIEKIKEQFKYYPPERNKQYGSFWYRTDYDDYEGRYQTKIYFDLPITLSWIFYRIEEESILVYSPRLSPASISGGKEEDIQYPLLKAVPISHRRVEMPDIVGIPRPSWLSRDGQFYCLQSEVLGLVMPYLEQLRGLLPAEIDFI